MPKLYLLLLLACAAGLNAGLIRESNSRCPEFHSKQDFDYHKYGGVWYQMKRFPNIFERGTSCCRAIYGIIMEGLLSVMNTSIRNGEQYAVDGTANAPSPDEPGHLHVNLTGSPPNGNIWILETDYTTYTAVYDCESVAGVKAEFAWIMTRNNTISSEVYQKASAAFTKYGVDLSKFEDTFQGDSCVYYP